MPGGGYWPGDNDHDTGDPGAHQVVTTVNSRLLQDNHLWLGQQYSFNVNTEKQGCVIFFEEQHVMGLISDSTLILSIVRSVEAKQQKNQIGKIIPWCHTIEIDTRLFKTNFLS